MKRVLTTIIIFALLFYSLSIGSYAEDGAIPDTADTEVIITTNNTTATEDVTEGEKSPDITWSERLVNFIKANVTETSLMTFALALAAFCIEHFSSNKKLKNHIGILNNNAIEIANTSAGKTEENTKELAALKDEMALFMDSLLVKVNDTLQSVVKTSEERDELEKKLTDNNKLLEKAIIAVNDSSDTVANLLIMSNIPNSKKEEIYSKHVAAVNSLKEIESEVTHRENI